MLLYVVGVVQATKQCGHDEYYDDVVRHDCRSCRIICDPVYRTPDECARKCPTGRLLTHYRTTDTEPMSLS